MRYRYGIVPKKTATTPVLFLLIAALVVYIIVANSFFSPRAECNRAARALGYEYAHPVPSQSCVILFEDYSWKAI